jgi:hypothetical protein
VTTLRSNHGDSEHGEGDAEWLPDLATLAAWSRLVPGMAIKVAKLDPQGREVTRYAARVVRTRPEERWVEVEARWTNRTVIVHGLRFETGDLLLERFSPLLPFNVFAVHGVDGGLRGWYANVTHPARLDTSGDSILLLWHDLYLDIVAFADGSFLVADEDELAASNLSATDPGLHAGILTARDELVLRLQQRRYPF